MRQYAVLGFVLAAAGCVEAADGELGDEPADEAIDEGTVAQQLGTPCPDWGCGVNSPQIDNSFFHELNIDGVANLEGYSMLSATKALAVYEVSVENARLIARYRFGNVEAPRTLTGNALEGLQISLRRVSPTTGALLSYRMIVEQVDRFVDFRAHPTDGSTTPPIETYKLYIQGDGPYGAYLCQNGTEIIPPNGPTPMTRHSALVFEGERINAQRKYISPILNTHWFNIGCAESAVAKLHLYGHTKASATAGFHTTIAERQTMLKMLVGDYCGTGKPFTVAGQPLAWEDDQRTMVMPAGFVRNTEARWTSTGAACLDTPRVVAHPSDESAETFPLGVERAIAAECTRPPACPLFDVSYHLRSYNRP